MKKYVKIDIEEYNRLRDFEKNIRGGKILRSAFWGECWIEEKELITMLKTEIEHYKLEKNSKLYSYSEKAIREMSVLEFIRARMYLRKNFKHKLIKCAEKCID